MAGASSIPDAAGGGFFGGVAARVVQLLIAAEFRRRHALHREELPVEIRQVVEARLEADIGDAQLARQSATGTRD